MGTVHLLTVQLVSSLIYYQKLKLLKHKMKMGGETSEDYGTFQNQRIRENSENSENGQNGFDESERQPLIDEEASEVEVKVDNGNVDVSAGAAEAAEAPRTVGTRPNHVVASSILLFW